MAAPQTDWTGDRAEFLGRNGTLAKPCGARSVALSKHGRRRPRSLRSHADDVELPPGETRRNRLFLLGKAAAPRMRAR